MPKTIISREYSFEWKPGDEPYYPVNDENTANCMLNTKSWLTKRRFLLNGDSITTKGCTGIGEI